MIIYRVIEESYSYGECNDFHRKSFISLDKAQQYKLSCEEEEIELQEQSNRCEMCKYGCGNQEPCNEYEKHKNSCGNYYFSNGECSYRIDEEEVEE